MARQMALARSRTGVYIAYHVPLGFSEVFIPEGEGEAQETGAAVETLAEAEELTAHVAAAGTRKQK